MVEIIIKRKTRRGAKDFRRHLEEEHPSTRGRIKIRNTKRKLKMRSKSLRAQAADVTNQRISI